MCKFTIYLECGHFVVASTFLIVLTYLFLLGLMELVLSENESIRVFMRWW